MQNFFEYLIWVLAKHYGRTRPMQVCRVCVLLKGGGEGGVGGGREDVRVC